jgi:adenylate cyclase class 2
MEEIEVKFLGIDPEAIQAKLASIGANKVGEFSYRRRVFDYPDFRLDTQGAWVRLREEGNKVMLSFKQRLGVKDDDSDDTGMEEIETEVGDIEVVTEILHRIGLIDKHFAENTRIRWKKGEIEFDIDTWPKLDPYLEIEAPTWERIDAAIRELGLDPDAKRICSTYQIYKSAGIDLADYARLTFSEMVKRT